jgi:hypothetical protein
MEPKHNLKSNYTLFLNFILFYIIFESLTSIEYYPQSNTMVNSASSKPEYNLRSKTRVYSASIEPKYNLQIILYFYKF